MPPETELVEGALLPDVYEPPTPATLFRTSDPGTALERMTEVANLLYKVVEDRRLYVTISGKKHLLVSAWTTLGGMLGLFPVVAWTRPNETGDGYLARVEVLTRDGQLVGAAESECSRAEQRWKSRDPFALRSMASTRATSRALRGPLEQVVTLAGFEAAAAEEMPADAAPAAPEPDPGPIPPEHRPTKQQLGQLRTLFNQLTAADPDTDWPAEARRIVGVPNEKLTRAIMSGLIRELEARLGTLGEDGS